MNGNGESRRSLLIVGGYGVVGSQIAEILSARHPELHLLIAGRSQENAHAVAAKLSNAQGIRIDVDQVDPLSALQTQPDVVLAVANDGKDNLLRSAAQREIAYVDVTRWTERMQTSILRLAPMHLAAPVILSSGWMAGVVATVAAADASEFARVDSINIDILFALKDKAGPNSLEYADRLTIPFPVRIDGQMQMKSALSDPREARFSGGRLFTTYRFDTPDQYTLAQATGAATVETRLSYDDASAIKSLRFLLSSGIWKVLSLSLFDNVRRSMLYNPGEGDTHEVLVETTGVDAAGKRLRTKSSIIDPLGQTHMTAAGAAMQVERVLGPRDGIGARNGLSFPEPAEDLSRLLGSLREMGVTIIHE